jgi:hypothetical protein
VHQVLATDAAPDDLVLQDAPTLGNRRLVVLVRSAVGERRVVFEEEVGHRQNA